MGQYENGFTATHGYAGLFVLAPKELQPIANTSLKKYYGQIQEAIRANPLFETSLKPIEMDCPSEIATQMKQAAKRAGVGPMAAVAGAVAQWVGKDLLAHTSEVFVENGGDIYLSSRAQRTVGVYAGDSVLSMRAGIVLPPGEWGVCTSAGRFGHSKSFGKAHAALCVAKDTALADCCATALGNAIQTWNDLEGALEQICAIQGIVGALAIIDDHIGYAGEIRVVGL